MPDFNRAFLFHLICMQIESCQRLVDYFFVIILIFDVGVTNFFLLTYYSSENEKSQLRKVGFRFTDKGNLLDMFHLLCCSHRNH